MLSTCHRYKLEARLPHPVKESEGKARFDKAKSTLEVVLPTQPPPKPCQDMSHSRKRSAEQQLEDFPHPPPPAIPSDGAYGEVQALHEQQPQDAEEDDEGFVLVPSPGARAEAHQEQEEGSGGQKQGHPQLTENERRWADIHQQHKAAEAAAAAVQGCTKAEGAALPRLCAESAENSQHKQQPVAVSSSAERAMQALAAAGLDPPAAAEGIHKQEVNEAPAEPMASLRPRLQCRQALDLD